MDPIIDLEVFGELPDTTTVTVHFRGIRESLEEDYLEKGRQVLIALHCERDSIDSETYS